MPARRHVSLLLSLVLAPACFQTRAPMGLRDTDDATSSTGSATDDPSVATAPSTTTPGSDDPSASSDDDSTSTGGDDDSTTDVPLADEDSSTSVDTDDASTSGGVDAICGDGSIAGDEECDDANASVGDGCSDECRIELDFFCADEPSICSSEICDPLVQDCGAPLGCFALGDQWACVESTGDADGQQGDPCETVADCTPGRACVSADAFDDCTADACCSRICDLDSPVCPSQWGCEAWYGLGEAPPGYENVGVCV